MKRKYIILSLIALMGLTGCTKYNGMQPEEAEHIHTYAETYSSDANEHWLAATCEHTEQRRAVGTHEFGDFVVAQEPTLNSEGMKVRTCSVCNYKNEVVLDKLLPNNPSEDNPDNPGVESWNITGITSDRESIEMTVGDSPISVVATLTGEGDFPKSMSVICEDKEASETRSSSKVIQVSASVIESGNGFTVGAIGAGETKIVITSAAKPAIKKEINVLVNPKPEVHTISLGNQELTIAKGGQTVLLCTSTDPVTWKTSNSVYVDLENKTNTGVWLKGKKATATNEPVTITATICAGTQYEASATCLVTVENTEQTVFKYYFINNQKLTDLHLYLADNDGASNALFPGVALSERTYVSKDMFDVYEITIDKDVKDYTKMIISGKDAENKYVQTNDILLSSFTVQNAFTIPTLPNDVQEGTRKASIKASTFNLTTDVFDKHFITLSMSNIQLVNGSSTDVVCFTSEDSVTYEVIEGEEIVSLSNKTKDGFTVKALGAGSAKVKASITSEDGTKEVIVYVTVVEDETVTYYFANNYGWKNMKVFLWGSKGNNADFPGNSFSHASVKNIDGVNTYSISFKKDADAYTGCIVSGEDVEHGKSKTENIVFADLDAAEKNMVYVTESAWDRIDTPGDVQYIRCTIGLGVFENYTPRLDILETTKQISIGQTANIEVTTNTEFTIQNSDETKVQATKSGKIIKLKGLAEGTAIITAIVNEGGVNIEKTVTVTVLPDEIVTYYFINEYEWTNVKVYLFNDDTHTNNTWPGEPMTYFDKNNRNKEIYSVSFAKNTKNWAGMVITGNDTVKGGMAKTQDIVLSELTEGINAFSITGWYDESNLIAKYSTLTFGDYLSISESSKTLAVDGKFSLTTHSTGTVSISNSDDTVVSVAKTGNTYEVTALKAGTATLTFSIGSGDNKITKTCVINVQNEPVSFTYKVTNLPSFYKENNPKLYAWVWGGDVAGSGKWIECSFVGDNIEFNSEIGNIEKCIILRIKPEYTGEPSFDLGNDIIWNKSNDLTFINREVAYAPQN